MEEQRLLRSGRLVTNAVRSPVRPATLWMRVVSMASARVIAGRMVVSRRASIGLPGPGGPRRRTLWAERLHHVQHHRFSGSAEHLPTCCPVESGVTRQVITVFLCTSKPAQWVKITSMAQLPWQRGWQDTQWSRLYSACSPPDRKVATMLGAYGYPGQTDVWVCGTPVSPTARPAYVVVFYLTRLALGGYHPRFHVSWWPVRHVQLT